MMVILVKLIFLRHLTKEIYVYFTKLTQARGKVKKNNEKNMKKSVKGRQNSHVFFLSLY